MMTGGELSHEEMAGKRLSDVFDSLTSWPKKGRYVRRWLC